MNDAQLSRREELLADAALSWLDDADAAAFTALVRDDAWQREFAALEQAAALASYALTEPTAPPAPAELVRLTAKLQADALAFFAQAPQATPAPPPPRLRPVDNHATLRVLPWLLAAASLVLLLWPQGQSLAEPEPAVARAQLLASPGGVVRCEWQPGPSPRRGEVAGDVVWDAQRQIGYLRLRGLPPLDASQRYQLWIVDETRQGPPVDGGLLALPAGEQEVVLPVAARLPVGRAAAFVLTVEAANGVVVSGQEHVVAIAKP